ncbi:MAG: hypothetical protein KGH66_01440 [Candidatus Micrarchaeota archaeon]|nr:hypothetical protein [Candidatus Micrarchaeota archaeon]
MEFNDIVYPTCNADADFAARLGFKRLLVAGKDVEIRDIDRDKNTNAKDCVVIGVNKPRLEAAAKSGAIAISITDQRIDRKLMQTMKERETKLLISFAVLKETGGNDRQRTLYMMSKLLRHAVKMRIEVCFASMARSRLHMLSTMQIIELAKLIGAEEDAARKGLKQIG